MSDIIILIILGAIPVLLCSIRFLSLSDKKFPQFLENTESSSVYRLNGFGTCMYGSKTLDEEQLQYYGFEQFEHEGEMYWPIATFKTIFITALWIPLFPLKTQIVIDSDGFDSGFYALPVETYWEQALNVLVVSYLMIFLIVTYLMITL